MFSQTVNHVLWLTINYAVDSSQPVHAYIPSYQLLAGIRFQYFMLLVQPSCLPTTQAKILQNANMALARFVRLSHDKCNQLFALPLYQTSWMVPARVPRRYLNVTNKTSDGLLVVK